MALAVPVATDVVGTWAAWLNLAQLGETFVAAGDHLQEDRMGQFDGPPCSVLTMSIGALPNAPVSNGPPGSMLHRSSAGPGGTVLGIG